MFHGVIVVMQKLYLKIQWQICSIELADKFKSYLWRFSDEDKARLGGEEIFTPDTLDRYK